ncbi:hypothetical protein, partial [Burkholderia multivorans]|uniref:hypothetical protein n=1 Tax=Burkholderia multivorans TaxID=87883 RepID=UPI001F3210CE
DFFRRSRRLGRIHPTISAAPPHGAARSGPVGGARSLRGIPVFFRIFFEITDDILAPRCAPLRARFLIPPVARDALRARRRRRT